MAVLRPRRRPFQSTRVVVGFLLTIVVEGFLFSISSPLAWRHHRWKVFFLIVLAVVSQPVCQRLWEIIPALWRVCRKPRFREAAAILACGAVAIACWIAGYWHYGYVRSSHFTLTVPGSWAVSTITDFKGVDPSVPVASVFFSQLMITNRYAPTAPRNWRLRATFSNGEELIGRPENGDAVFGGLMFRADSFIYSEEYLKIFKPLGGIGNGIKLGAPAEFVFVGVRPETLLSPDATLIVEFEGLNETVTALAPSHLREIAVSPQITNPPSH